MTMTSLTFEFNERCAGARNVRAWVLMGFVSLAAFGQDASHVPSHEAATDGKAKGILDLSLDRQVSGTAWQPDDTPHFGTMFQAGDWEGMAHGLLFGGLDVQNRGDRNLRGDRDWIGTGWVMGMATRRFERSTLTFRAMLSPEPFTTPKDGYPLLLQTGEAYRGQPLHDRQHPHDLFMEIAALYTREVGDGKGLQLYIAPAGEPALGPVAFPHRASSMANPLGALGHHWQDSTHISFGVVTGAFLTRTTKLEVSCFNGREPDEVRTNFDLRRLDSWSGRFTVNPNAHVSAQVSFGFLKSPEALEPETSVHRATASVMVHHGLGPEGRATTTVIFGRNVPGGPHPEVPTSSGLIETNLDLTHRHTVFARLEAFQKTGRELVLPAASVQDTRFDLAAFNLGYLYNFAPMGPVTLGLGIRGDVYRVPEALVPFYGRRVPTGGMVFLRMVSKPMNMPMDGMHP